MTENNSTGRPTGVAPVGLIVDTSITDNALTTSNYVDSNWYRDNVVHMPVDVLKRHQMDLESKLALFSQNLLNLIEGERLEIERAVQHIANRLDDVLPKVPATIDEHDRNVGNRVHDNWPIWSKKEAINLHLHFCELIDSWKINPYRRINDSVSVNTIAEHNGMSAFNFGNSQDMGDFIDYYQLSDFVVTRTTESPGGTHPNCHLVLSNSFTKEQIQQFMNIYKSVINNLALIHDERRRATNIDGGKIGYLSAEHFNARETIELNRMKSARHILGMGAKATPPRTQQL